MIYIRGLKNLPHKDMVLKEVTLIAVFKQDMSSIFNTSFIIKIQPKLRSNLKFDRMHLI